MQYLIVDVGKEQYMIDSQCVVSVENCGNITELPRDKEYVLGVTQIRGSVVGVLDMGLILGMSPIEVNKESRFVLVTHDGQTSALLVSKAINVVQIEEDSIDKSSDAFVGLNGDGLITGIAKTNGNIFPIIDFTSILAA